MKNTDKLFWQRKISSWYFSWFFETIPPLLTLLLVYYMNMAIRRQKEHKSWFTLFRTKSRKCQTNATQSHDWSIIRVDTCSYSVVHIVSEATRLHFHLEQIAIALSKFWQGIDAKRSSPRVIKQNVFTFDTIKYPAFITIYNRFNYPLRVIRPGFSPSLWSFPIKLTSNVECSG